MTDERARQLCRQMASWFNGHIRDKQELFQTLHKELGLSRCDLRDLGIVSVDSFFPQEDVRAILGKKVEDALKEYKTAWLALSVPELLERVAEIARVTRAAEALPKAVTEDEAAYLIRFKNPLNVVLTEWKEHHGTPWPDPCELSYVLMCLEDTGKAESRFEMEPEIAE